MSESGCPVQATVNVLRGKWKVSILWNLAFGPKRFAEIRNRMKGISEKVLIAQLRQLQKDGVILRAVANTSPPQVTYSLSKPGLQLVVHMKSLCDWGSAHFHIKPTIGVPPFLRRRATASKPAA